MKILYCASCTKKVAEVRDASLIKGLVCLCPKCNETRLKERERLVNLKTLINNQRGKKFKSDIFGDLFNQR